MQSPREILTDLWALADGDPSALDAVTLTGEEPQLPSSFRVAAAAQVSIAAAGLAAAQIWKLRSGQPELRRRTTALSSQPSPINSSCHRAQDDPIHLKLNILKDDDPDHTRHAAE